MARAAAVTGFLLLDSLLAGAGTPSSTRLRHLVLPAVTLSLGGLATIARFTRAGVLDTLQKDFVLLRPRHRLSPRGAWSGSTCCATP